jgi:hypothetical protein
MKNRIKYLVALSVALGTSGSVFGAFVDFDVGDGDWDVSSNWNAGAGPLPGSGDTARIDEGYTATIKTGVTGTTAKVSLGGFSGAGTLIVDAGGTLSTAVDSTIATSRKTGILDVSGTVSGTGSFLMGGGNTSTGTVLVKSGAVVSAGGISIGNGSSAGTYSVTQTGGAVSLTGSLLIADGDDSLSSGTYTISDGSLSALSMDMGGNGTSTAKFSVGGSAATNISFSGISDFGGQAELEFILDGAGVTSLDMTAGGYSIASTVLLTVDASAFDINTIGSGILLIGTTGISSEFNVANVTLTSGYDLDYRADGLFLILPDNLWDNSFAGTALNDSWRVNVTGDSTVTQNDGLVILPDGTGGFDRGFLATNNVQYAEDPAFKAQFNGNPAYNFFEHGLQLTYDALSIPSDVTAGNLIFYSGVSGNPVTASASPRGGQPGAFLRVRQGVSVLKLEVLEGAIPDGPGRAVYGTKTLTALPDSIVFNLNATGWSVEITGTTFTDATTTTSGTWANISAATFATDAALIVGTYQEASAAWTSGDPITLGGFQATAYLLAFPELPEYILWGDLNRDGVVDASDQSFAQSYLDGSIDGGDDAATRIAAEMALSGSTSEEALAALNLTEFDVNGDGAFDAADVALVPSLAGAIMASTSVVFNGSSEFEIVVDGLIPTVNYHLQRTADLSVDFTTVNTVEAASATETFTDPTPLAGKAFYKVTN